jgi:hypothetical protein
VAEDEDENEDSDAENDDDDDDDEDEAGTEADDGEEEGPWERALSPRVWSVLPSSSSAVDFL